MYLEKHNIFVQLLWYDPCVLLLLMNQRLDLITKLLTEHLENSPHKIVYEPKYPGELYVVSDNYRKLARKTARKIIKTLEEYE